MPRKAEIVLRNGKPVAVILDIAEYEKLLELTEDSDDIKSLKAMRKKPLRFLTLDAILRKKKPN